MDARRGLAAGLLLLAPAFAHAADATNCLQVVNNTRGKMCGNPNSAEAGLRNTCSATINAQVCLEDRKGIAHCGSNGTMSPGDRVYQYICDGTGRFVYWGCTKEPGKYGGNCGGNWNGKPFPR